MNALLKMSESLRRMLEAVALASRVATRRHGGRHLLRRARAEDRSARAPDEAPGAGVVLLAAIFSLWMGYGYVINAHPRVVLDQRLIEKYRIT
jgi:hypothetical protein